MRRVSSAYFEGASLFANPFPDGNLDTGNFVLNAIGERWAGELCQDDYLAPLYFSSKAQDSTR